MAEINVTPLVDVVLVLLIIFMVTAPFLQGGLEIDLPKVATARTRRARGADRERARATARSRSANAWCRLGAVRGRAGRARAPRTAGVPQGRPAACPTALIVELIARMRRAGRRVARTRDRAAAARGADPCAARSSAPAVVHLAMLVAALFMRARPDAADRVRDPTWCRSSLVDARLRVVAGAPAPAKTRSRRARSPTVVARADGRRRRSWSRPSRRSRRSRAATPEPAREPERRPPALPYARGRQRRAERADARWTRQTSSSPTT